MRNQPDFSNVLDAEWRLFTSEIIIEQNSHVLEASPG
jgi:hypothetical protein